jgi:hypothetical protein
MKQKQRSIIIGRQPRADATLGTPKKRSIKRLTSPTARGPSVVTINRPDVVADIGRAADTFTDGNKTEAVALAVRRLLEQDARVGSLFGANRGSVRFREGVDPIAPALDVEPDAETGREIDR